MKTKLFCALAALSIAAPAPAQTYKEAAAVFANNCTGCHNSQVKMGSLDLESFETMMRGGNHGTIVVPGNSAESRLFLMITGKATPAMPLSGKALAAGDIDAIRRWIDAGARPPAPGELPPAKSVAKIAPRAPVKAGIGALAYRPDGKLLALAGYKEVRLVDPQSGNVVATLGGHAEMVRAVAFSSDGKLLAAAGGLPARRGELKLWDVDRRAELRTIAGHADCMYAVAIAPDGKSVATSSYDKLIKLWDIATGRELRTLKDHIDAVYALAFTADGARLVSAAADRTVKVWDVASGKRLYTLGEPTDGLNTIALDPTGKRVAAGGLDKTIRIWTLGEINGTMVESLIAHEDAILKLAWSPDGKLLASSAADKTIKIFNAAGLTEIRTFDRQPDWVLSLEWAPDGRSLAAGRFDGSLQIFHDFGSTHVARR